jgi:succinate-acetate transporter protein
MFVLSLYNILTSGVAVPDAIVGTFCFASGIAQLFAGWGGMSLTTFFPKDTIG